MNIEQLRQEVKNLILANEPILATNLMVKNKDILSKEEAIELIKSIIPEPKTATPKDKLYAFDDVDQIPDATWGKILKKVLINDKVKALRNENYEVCYVITTTLENLYIKFPELKD